MTGDLVSVIIPTYNRPHYLEQAVVSVLNQSYKNIEVIVVDDGTPGVKNKEICEKLGVNYLKISNSGGPAKPRNQGFKIAKGIYIAWLDDDDLWLPTKIEKQILFLNSNPAFKWVHCLNGYIDQEGKEQERSGKRDFSFDDVEGDLFLKSINTVLIKNPTPLLKRELIEAAGLFNEKLRGSEDWEYWFRLAWFSPIGLVREHLALYRVGNKNKISSNDKNYATIPVAMADFVNGLVAQNEAEQVKISKAQLIVKQLAKKRFKSRALLDLSWQDKLKLTRVAFL